MRHHIPSIPLFFSLALGFFAGCPGGGTGTPDAAPPDGPAITGIVELGTGTTQFQSLVDEQELTLIAGPQGGYHFIVHARTQEIEPGDWERPSAEGNPITLFSAFDEDENQVDLMLPPYALGFRDLGDDWWYLPSGRFLRVENDLAPLLIGTRLRIEVFIEDADGAIARDQRWVTVVAE